MNARKIQFVLSISCAFLVFQSFSWKAPQSWENNQIELEKQYPFSLSEYGFFTGDIAAQQPASRVVPYTLNTPLFTDYAYKLRFISFPEGKTANYHPTQVMDFPEGTTIIKTFYYYHDERKPEKGRRLMETRVLIKEADEWVALPYIWDEEQKDAYLEVAGGRYEVTWKDNAGKKQKFEYVVPNMNQCKECHERDQHITPIGPSARQMNRDLEFPTGVANQLEYMNDHGYLTGLPAKADRPKLAQWDQPQQFDLDARARAYLDANCGHCHNPKGPANTSGMYLDAHTTEPVELGVNKVPIAAGKGSGGRKYGIVPGDPDGSILLFRMESLNPGIMMPELGRKLKHEEGVQLIRKWIEAM